MAVASAPALASTCSLADHIRSANTNPAVGFCPAGTSHDVITITEDIVLSEQLPPITGTITIEGGGHTISGDKKFPIFVVEGGRLTINNLTLTKSDGTEGRGGSAISARSSSLTINNTSFVGNRGPAIYIWGSTGLIRNSSFVSNRSQYGNGAAIFVGQGVTLDVINSTFHANTARHGGALATNVTTFRGIMPSRTTLTNVTITPSRVAGRGVGFNIWIDENDANFKLRSSLIVGGKSEYRKESSSCQGPLAENIGNFIEDGSCSSGTGGDARLGDLTGAPHHHPPLDGSPALDSADPRFCPDTDQLGTPRPYGGGCDIGAIESTTALPKPPPLLPPPPCPLATQIIAANTDAPAGGCPAGSGHDVITLSEDIKLDTALPAIASEITIEGNGQTISGGNLFGILEVDGGALTIRNATLTQGNAARGGAISLKNGGRASIADVMFSENFAFFGGAIATESEGDQVQVSGSSFVDNRAETAGGAIHVDDGSVAVGGSAFVNNQAESRGGAISAIRGQAQISNSTISGNMAEAGGGIHVDGATATLTQLTLAHNRAGRVYGAGLYREAGAVYLRNSIIAESGSGDDCTGQLAESRGNFSEDGRCATPAGEDAMLEPLTGALAHHPLTDASPAHGAADLAYCTEADQLGNPRTHCDIGAVESARAPGYVAAPIVLPNGCTLADQIIAANTDAPAGACPAGDGADVIRLRQDLTLTEPLPTIKGDLAIDGNGHSISGDNRFRIFDIESGKVVLKHITLSDGRNTGDEPEGYGGAVTARESAELMLVNATFRITRARMGGAVASIGASRLNVFDSSFLDNEASSEGGAIWRHGVCSYIFEVSFRRNIAGELPGSVNGDYLTHMNFGTRTCSADPEVYTLSDN